MTERDITEEQVHAAAAGTAGPGGAERAALVDILTGRDEKVAPGGSGTDQLENLTAKDFQLSNFSDRDVNKLEFYLELVLELRRISYPHEGQSMTGITRAWAHGDPDAAKWALTKDQLIQDETFREDVRSRVLQGKDMALLETTGKTTRESRLSREDDGSGGGGILGKVTGDD